MAEFKRLRELPVAGEATAVCIASGHSRPGAPARGQASAGLVPTHQSSLLQPMDQLDINGMQIGCVFESMYFEFEIKSQISKLLFVGV